MSITQQDVARIARLARIQLSPNDVAHAQADLDEMLGLIEQLQAVDTTDVVPMAHPLSAHQDIMLRLRPDVAAPTNTLAQRQALMVNSPAEEDGLFLVPTVIE
ncbi:Asp-tRNA(Asn)/Glu-tRNA(Gln) amidotransferase GatCAB subunit C [Pollutimonas nitritireducens]|uniref:Aspartyl/glutamyl-tRNA(Asn/Gln) amidotransferase subunit C n=1 Tax=Pollutimonas nitritireducens TaxID=2045209 RepID=A0A2N4UI90_9BURK|nr:Asp-tRNA(Asn)/Glu-tRNA(Gln) amidotransferase subunit GatC [Pollutimonas nitritireducens]PLC54746.1 Asp-tRNA(Asn)/Glu-tRNA(Gln) amidotransferase GatCAB subunit C [Pollutimonas nitritireducens]